MRIWTLHPKYLDTRGLTVVWRDALEAQQVLKGKTRTGGNLYQLIRFKEQPDPVACIATYLAAIAEEAATRGYQFDLEKIDQRRTEQQIATTEGQLVFELGHLRSKLAYRDRGRFEELGRVRVPEAHPLFVVIPGEVEGWETRKDD